MNTFINRLLILVLAGSIISCGDSDTKEITTNDDRSVQYFPNMYQSVGYETYQEGQIFPNNMEAQKPVEGTVSRGWMPYEYEDNNEGYASAKANLTNPLPYTEENLNQGEALYNIYCAICHGKNGNGQGHLVKTEKILGVPSYDSREITQGSIYHVLYYGINYMGSYASQTTIEERWQIAHHVDALTRDLKGEERQAFVEGNNDGLFSAYGDNIITESADSTTEQPAEVEEMNDQEQNSNNTNGN